jgi:hypothetical protein
MYIKFTSGESKIDGKVDPYHIRSPGITLFIQEIIRKSDVNWEINLPVIAVVGSQSTGMLYLMQERARFLRALSEKKYFPKAKE